MKLAFILGTRPEAIKLAPVIFAARRHKNIETIVCTTGQHREMLQQALAMFEITPDIQLDVMSPNQILSQLTAKLMQQISDALLASQPDYVVVQGDTTSAFTGGLAAFYQGIPVAHVEAGLRTHDLTSPFPEELNRQLLGKVASWHFPPTQMGLENLMREGMSAARVRVTGNTVVDAINDMRQRWQRVKVQLPEQLMKPIAAGHLALVTCHRRESFGEPLLAVCHALRTLSEKYADIQWIFPVHLNPNVRDIVFKELQHLPNMHLVDPVNYETMLYLISCAKLIVTDSGGVQEEAPSFGVPVVVMRDNTERAEGVKAGMAVLAGRDPEKIISAASYFLDNQISFVGQPNPYGDGKASERIIDTLLGNDVGDFYG